MAVCVVGALPLSACGDSGSSGGGGGSDSGNAKEVALGAPVEITIPDTKAKPVKMQVVIDVTRGSVADLSDFNLEAADKKMTPYYVKQRITNLDQTTDNAVMSLKVLNDDGTPAKELTLLGNFPRCESRSAPSAFTKGATLTTCDVYLAPKGHSVAKVTYTELTFDGSPNNDYTWKVGG
jgi:hypothetical protein